MKGGTIRIKGNAGNDIGTFMLGGTIIIEKNAFIHVSTHAEGGTVIIKGDVEGRVGGQMVKGEMYVLGKIKFMMPGYQKVDTVEKEVDGVKATFDHYIGDLGERHRKSKGADRVREPVPESGGMNLPSITHIRPEQPAPFFSYHNHRDISMSMRMIL